MTTRTWRAKRRIGAAALVALIGSTLAFASSATAITAGGDAESARLSGDNRAATAADIYLDEDTGWDATDSAYDVTIVNGNNFPDGLAASIYANPILLVNADSIPAETSAALAAAELAADVGTITIVGGTSVVSSAVLEQLDALNGADTVVRVAGDDRYSTAAAVAADVLGIWGDATTCDMILATGENFPDALAAGPLAIDAEAPILLNTGDSLLPVVKATITGALGTGNFCELGVPTIHIVGGPAAVPASVEAELQSMGINVARWAGANRAETAVAVAGALSAIGFGQDNIVLVNGNGYADALAAGPYAYDVDGVIMPVNADSIPAAVAGYHVAMCNDLTWDPQVTAIGGTAVISDAVLAAADAAATCSVPSYSATLTTTVASQAEYEATDMGAVADGVTLTAVAGSAADGAAGNGWTITIGDAGADPSSAVVGGTTLTISLSGLATGLSQADMAAAINGLPAAAALFTAAPNGDTGAPAAYDGSAIAVAATANAGSEIQQVVLTFSEDVDDTANTTTGAVLEDGDIAFGGTTGAFTSQSPLALTPGGASVYTFNYLVTDTANKMAVGDDVTATAWSTANGAAAANAVQATLTAG